MRYTARLIVLNEQNRVLLFKCEDNRIKSKDNSLECAFWYTPGGGLVENETYEVAAHRELLEETAINADIGPCIWVHTHQLHYNNKMITFHERYYLTFVTAVEVVVDHNPDSIEKSAYRGYRWWTIEEIQNSNELIFPIKLGLLLPSIIAGDMPSKPIEIEHVL